MADTFQRVADKYSNSPTAVVLFVAAIIMMVIGINNFAEDTYSSYLGLKQLEMSYGLKVQIFDWTYWVMSIAPQIASIVFFYLYLATQDRKYLMISLGFQAADIFADSWYRSDARLLTDPMVAIMSGVLTLVYFSLGSEFFITISAGLILKLYAPALREWQKARGGVQAAKRDFSGGGGGFKPPQGGGRPDFKQSQGGGSQRRQELERSRSDGGDSFRPAPKPSGNGYKPQYAGGGIRDLNDEEDD